MTLVVGVDPGINGAMAMYDARTCRLVKLDDMPTWSMPVGKRVRTRVDAVDLANYFETAKLLGVDCVVIEAVGGRPRQSASSGFVFGYTVGLIYMSCIACRLHIETVPPDQWKKLLSVKGKGRANEDAIMARADELFPDDRNMFRGPQGGRKLDRAEAAMLAYFGAKHCITNPYVKDPEMTGVYRNADTGC